MLIIKTDWIHIVFSIHDTDGSYSKNIGAVIVSIFEHTKEKVKVHLLHDQTLNEGNRHNFMVLCQKYNQEIVFYDVKLPSYVEKYKSIRDLSVGSLFRLYIPILLEDIKRVIYLDADMIVYLDVDSLWRENIEEYAIGAVLDIAETRKAVSENKFFRKLSICGDAYFNAGMLLLNLDKIREYRLLERSLDFLNENPGAPNLDQEALNYLLQNDCMILDEKYNKIVVDFAESNKMMQNNQQCIYHFAGSIKPWHIYNAVSKYYWKYLSMTPWADTIEKFIEFFPKVTTTLEEDILVRKIRSRRIFLINFIQRFLKEVKLKVWGK